MSTWLSWQPVASKHFDYNGGDTQGTVADNLKKLFMLEFPMTLTHAEHFTAMNVMARMSPVDGSIYHQICDALVEHKSIIIDVC